MIHAPQRVRSYVIQVLIMHTTGIEDTGKNKIYKFKKIDENVHNSMRS